MQNQAETGFSKGREPLRTVSVGSGRMCVQLALAPQGRDLLLQITGGQAHVGAVAVCEGGAGRAVARGGGTNLELPGHREGPLAVEAAETLAAATGRTCAVVAGIHQDDATPAEIRQIIANVKAGLQQLLVALAAGTTEKENL